MKIILSKKVKWWGSAGIGICLCVLILLNIVGYVLDCKYISVAAAIAEINEYEIRSRLLMEAMQQVGVCTPEDAAKTWAEGLKSRSAALQYAVMKPLLREEYAKQLEKTAKNWVTGMSSPWVENYQIVQIEAPNENKRVIQLKISTATSTGPAGDYTAQLTIIRDGSFWRIEKIVMDKGLYPYTGFETPKPAS
jgi:hypothetical protein